MIVSRMKISMENVVNFIYKNYRQEIENCED